MTIEKLLTNVVKDIEILKSAGGDPEVFDAIQSSYETVAVTATLSEVVSMEPGFLVGTSKPGFNEITSSPEE